MCNHVSTPSRSRLESVAGEEGLIIEGEFENQYRISGYAQPILPVTLSSGPNIIQTARQRMINLWTKDTKEEQTFTDIGTVHLNKLFVKPCYKICIQQYRGLLWVDGFFLRLSLGDSEQLKSEQRYYYKQDKEIFTLGIVYAPWMNPATGETLNTFSIITTSTKGMPLVIHKEDHDKWLNDHSKDGIRSCFKRVPNDFFLNHKTKLNLKGANGNVPKMQLVAL